MELTSKLARIAASSRLGETSSTGSMATYVAPLNTQVNGIELVGGKGRSLSILANMGLSVPDGFHVTTSAYRLVVEQHGLQGDILDLAQPEFTEGVVSFETASSNIHALFKTIRISNDLRSEILKMYRETIDSELAVAVRSSANAEDLPELSFAGQQETFLNVMGEDSLLRAIQNCWASLWTPQALSYRLQNGIDNSTVAMSVVVQAMIPSEISGILFTANPTTGDRNEFVINSSYGLGEAVVGGLVTPDTYIVNRSDGSVKQEVIGPKAQSVVPLQDGGTETVEVGTDESDVSSLGSLELRELHEVATKIETQYEGVPQDIEWAYADRQLHILQSRPITNLPVQPIDVSWDVPPPAKYVSRRQIVENMPDPICPLFEELYLTKGLESSRKGMNLMVGGGPMFITVNGYAYQRFDFEMVHKQARDKGLLRPTEEEIDAAEIEAESKAKSKRSTRGPTEEEVKAGIQRDLEIRQRDIERFCNDLSNDDRLAFDEWMSEHSATDIARTLTMPKSKNPTYVAFNNTEWNDRQLGEWFETTRPRLIEIGEKWSQVDPQTSSDSHLLEGICEMGIEEGYYWSSNSSHTFGVAKSTDDQLQCYLRETLPDQHFISGQFLSGIESKAMQANSDLFEIAKKIRPADDLKHVVLTTPSKYLYDALRNRNDSREVVEDIEIYLNNYGHQGYSLDFMEPTQIENPAALFATLRAMVQNPDYDPRAQDERASKTRQEKLAEISECLEGLQYWQFRFRLWLARKYNYIREEVAFLFGYTWSILRPMAFELGRRLVDVGTLSHYQDVFFLVSEELQEAIEARSLSKSLPNLGETAAARRELREARKQHHPPGTLPLEASQIDGIAFKETQILNDESSETMRGFPVSSGQVTAKASVVTGPSEFDKMMPGSILVSPLTTPAWTQLFAHAAGLVTDVGSILAHGSIVAREYGIPAVLGVGNGTIRIRHGQTITINGDVGTVVLHNEDQD